jgi:hypothetical protein
MDGIGQRAWWFDRSSPRAGAAWCARSGRQLARDERAASQSAACSTNRGHSSSAPGSHRRPRPRAARAAASRSRALDSSPRASTTLSPLRWPKLYAASARSRALSTLLSAAEIFACIHRKYPISGASGVTASLERSQSSPLPGQFHCVPCGWWTARRAAAPQRVALYGWPVATRGETEEDLRNHPKHVGYRGVQFSVDCAPAPVRRQAATGVTRNSANSTQIESVK